MRHCLSEQVDMQAAQTEAQRLHLKLFTKLTLRARNTLFWAAHEPTRRETQLVCTVGWKVCVCDDDGHAPFSTRSGLPRVPLAHANESLWFERQLDCSEIVVHCKAVPMHRANE